MIWVLIPLGFALLVLVAGVGLAFGVVQLSKWRDRQAAFRRTDK